MIVVSGSRASRGRKQREKNDEIFVEKTLLDLEGIYAGTETGRQFTFCGFHLSFDRSCPKKKRNNFVIVALQGVPEEVEGIPERTASS